MNLAELLTVDRIVPEMEATEHWPAIEELVEHLDGLGLLDAGTKLEVLAALREREERISTGIGLGVAIPHAFSDHVDEVLTVFGRSLKGIDFESIDNAPVRFVVLFVVPNDQYHEHLRTLAAIAKIFHNGEIRTQLTEAADGEGILRVLRERVKGVTVASGDQGDDREGREGNG